MGFGMAQSLSRAGFSVAGFDVSPEAVARWAAEGGRGANSPAQTAEGAEIVVSVVVNAAQTEAILFGDLGVAETLPEGGVFISCATMAPEIARQFAARLKAAGRRACCRGERGDGLRGAAGAGFGEGL